MPNQYLYRYDRLDNLTNAASPSRKDGLSVNTVMVYDALSRLTGDNWSGFAYDAASNLVWTANGNSGVSYDFAYDALNRRVGAIAGGSYLSAVTFTYGYDALSRRPRGADTDPHPCIRLYDGFHFCGSGRCEWAPT